MSKESIQYVRGISTMKKKNVSKEYGELRKGGREEEAWKSVLEQLRYSSCLAFQKS